MFEWINDPSAWLALATLTFLEIVLGIDNIIFIVVLTSRLPKEKQKKARFLGLSLAMITRLLLLASLFWIMKLTKPLFTVVGFEISGRDLILIIGGLFLLWKSTIEIHNEIQHAKNAKKEESKKKSLNFFSVLIQIALLDIIFSLDSVITAVGLADQLEVMVIAVIIAVLIMMLASEFISKFIEANPTIKVLALSFLILIGVTLIADGLSFHISKAYIYFAIGFSLLVEMINIKISNSNKIQNEH